jgi:hypothetical protein
MAAHRKEKVFWLEVPMHHVHGVTVLHNLHRRIPSNSNSNSAEGKM